MSFSTWIKPDQYTVNPLKLAELADEYAAAEVSRFYDLLVKHRAKFWPNDSAGSQLAQIRLDDYSHKDAPDLESLLAVIEFRKEQ